MKKTKLFGANIEPDCSYCQNGLFNGNIYVCCVKKSIKNGKCRKFYYNPTLRVPHKKQLFSDFTPEDFKL